MLTIWSIGYIPKISLLKHQYYQTYFLAFNDIRKINIQISFIFRYERVWDEADYVIPPAENGAFFVTTNVVITPNQTWGTCPEVSMHI